MRLSLSFPPIPMNVHHSSKTDQWFTPKAFFQRVEAAFGTFELDVCASPTNAKAAKFFTEADDGLSQRWDGLCWMNPPYGRELADWIAKARRSALENPAVVVCLVPARTDTNWFHRDIASCPFAHVVLIKGRIRFEDGSGNGVTNSAPFPSMLVVYSRNDIQRALDALAPRSAIGVRTMNAA